MVVVTAGGAALTLALLTAPPVLLLAVCAVLVAAALLRHSMLLLAALIALVVTNVAEVAAAHAPVRLYLLTVALTIIGTALGVLRREVALRWSPVLTAALCYLGARVLSLLAAEDLPVGVGVLAAEAQQLLVLVLLTLLMTPHAVRGATAVAVTCLAVLASLGVVQELAPGDVGDLGGFAGVLAADLGGATGRHTGSLGDPNFWGRLLVLFTPLSLSLCVSAHSLWGRGGWALAACSLLAGSYLTQSRGALLAVAVAVVVWFLLVGRRYSRLLVLLPAVLAVLLSVPGVSSRLSTLPGLGSPAPTVDGSILQRAAVQRLGLAMAADRPLLGVGAGNFERAQVEYARQTGVDLDPTAAHNVYLQMAAEGGVVGLLALVLLLGTGLLLGARVLRRPPHAPRSASVLSAGVIAGLVGWMVASLFLHLSELDSLFVVLALAAALDAAPREADSRPLLHAEHSVSAGGSRTRQSRRGFRALVAGLLVVVAITALSARVHPRDRWEAQQELLVEPLPLLAPDVERYANDLLTRPYLLPTLAVVLDERLRASASDGGGRVWVRQTARARPVLLSLRVTGATPGRAVDAVSAASAEAEALLPRATGLFAVRPLAVRTTATPVGAQDVGTGVAAGAVVGLVLVRRSGSSGQDRHRVNLVRVRRLSGFHLVSERVDRAE